MRFPEDHARFSELFERYHRHVLTYCMRRTRTEADAEDATAEAFVVAWRRRDIAPRSDAALPWLYAIARRTLANQRRANGRRDRLSRGLVASADAGTVAGEAPGPAIAALERLSPADQEVLRLVAWEGLGHGEIAEVLGVSANAVGIRVHRARIRFEAELRRMSPGPVKEIEGRRTSTRLKGRMIGLLRRESPK